MEQLRSFMESKFGLAPAMAGTVLGLILGLVIGWGIWPVQWIDAGPEHLRSDFQSDWVRFSVEDYQKTGDNEMLAKRIGRFGEDSEAVFAAAGEGLSADMQGQLDNAVANVNTTLESAGAMAEGAVEGAAEAGQGMLDRLRLPLFLCGALVFLGLLAVGGWFLMTTNRRRGSRRSVSMPDIFPDDNDTESFEADIASSDFELPDSPIADIVSETYTEPIGGGVDPLPTAAAGQDVKQFMTTYMLGDDLYDDSFTIDDATGDFLGECGVGISETVGVGEPKKVSAFEVWLFDKNDIRTVTKVVMSEHAYLDEGLKSKLSAKGEPVLAQPGETIMLETATLQIAARIVEMDYGAGPLPDNSYFDRMTVELSAWKKEGGDPVA